MKITNSLREEIRSQFLSDLSDYREYNLDTADSSKELLKEYITDWCKEHQEYLDAIIEEVDSIDNVEYITDSLDYNLYREADQILLNFIDEIDNINNNVMKEDYDQMEIGENGLPKLKYPYTMTERKDGRYQITSMHPYDLTDYSYAISKNKNIDDSWTVNDPADKRNNVLASDWNSALQIMKRLDDTKEPNIDRS